MNVACRQPSWQSTREAHMLHPPYLKCCPSDVLGAVLNCPSGSPAGRAHPRRTSTSHTACGKRRRCTDRAHQRPAFRYFWRGTMMQRCTKVLFRAGRQVWRMRSLGTPAPCLQLCVCACVGSLECKMGKEDVDSKKERKKNEESRQQTWLLLLGGGKGGKGGERGPITVVSSCGYVVWLIDVVKSRG
eukprot:1140026-Pelagomonas_calceolata.AAC.1